MTMSKKVQFNMVFLVLFLIAGQLFAGGNKEIPDVPPITSGPQYFSPDSNGVQDTAVLSFSVKVYVKSVEGYVPEYGLQILDSAGKVMKEVVETEKSDIGWFSSIFRGYSEFSLDSMLSEIKAQLNRIIKSYKPTDEILKRIESIVIEARDLNEVLSDDIEKAEINPELLEKVNLRIDLLNNLTCSCKKDYEYKLNKGLI
jgi:hypothetical protein